MRITVRGLFQTSSCSSKLQRTATGAEGNLQQIRRSKMPTKGNIALDREFVGKRKHQILISELGGSKIQRQVSTSKRDPDRQQERKISKCTTVRSKRYRVEWSLQGIDHTNFTRSSSRRKDTARDFHKTNFFRSYILTKAKFSATGIGNTFERMDEDCRQLRFVTYDGIVFSESQSKREDLSNVKHNSGYSDRRWHCGLRHTSEGLHQGTWRFSLETFGERNYQNIKG